MELRRFTVMVLASAAVLWGLELFIHGYLLMPWYQETADVWRPFAEMMQISPLSAIGVGIFAFVFSLMFIIGYKGHGVVEGLRFGVLVGGLFSASMLGWHAILPVPEKLTFAWIAAAMVEGIVLGVINAWIYAPRSPKEAQTL